MLIPGGGGKKRPAAINTDDFAEQSKSGSYGGLVGAAAHGGGAGEELASSSPNLGVGEISCTDVTTAVPSHIPKGACSASTACCPLERKVLDFVTVATL